MKKKKGSIQAKLLLSSVGFFILGLVVIFFTVAQRIDKLSNVMGVVGIDVEQTAISDILNKIRLGDTGYFMLIDNTGVVMADGMNADNNLKNVSDIGIEKLDQVLTENVDITSVVNNEEYRILSHSLEGTELGTCFSYVC